MKQITLDKMFLKPKLLMSALVVLSLSLFSMLSIAAQSGVTEASGMTQTEQPARDFNQMVKGLTGSKAPTERSTRDFNHMVTGFPLAGAHAIAECGSCHVGGIFKGTPRNCSGCHAKGKRVVATAMSSKHLVTTEPCEVCHTNTVTFLGARYNHGKAQPGACASCHNGLIATGKAASHKSGVKATKSCDNCHRTYAWTPASWNHVGVTPGTCGNANCHGTGGSITKPASHTSTAKATYACDSCHNSYLSWYPAVYNHVGAVTCATCHSYTTGINATPIKTNHISTTSGCESCHKSYTTWLGASFHDANVTNTCGTGGCHDGSVSSTMSKASTTHIPTVGINCDACHSSTTSFAIWSMNHNVAVTGQSGCKVCHSNSPAYPGVTHRKTVGSHEGSSASQDCNSSGCHTKGISWRE